MIDLNLKPDRKHLRDFGWVALVVFGLLGAVVTWKHAIVGIHLSEPATRTTAMVLWGLGALSGLLSMVRPEWNRFLYIGLMLAAFPIGFVVSHVIIAIIFFVIITPVGLVFRLMGRDALSRRFDRNAPSYWVDKKPVESVERYFRQF
ncbi:MAG TPA: SxtJ family membrane protein [Candidatus Eisenbacteria bacterium]